MRRLAALLALPVLAGCADWATESAPKPVPKPQFTVGGPYQAGGVWQYPQAEFSANLTGLAVVAADREGLTADGEAFDQTALTAGHRTLQLPAIIRVTNLENGRQVVLRLNDRGPENPGRLLALSRRAGELLAVAGLATRVRVQVMEEESRLLALSLQGGGPALGVTAVPRGDVASESLTPPDGASQAARVRAAASRAQPAASGSGLAASAMPVRLPEEVQQGAANPGALYIALGTFSRADAASILANRLGYLGARITTSFTSPRERAYRVRIGPLDDVPAADDLLQRALSAGVPDAAIIVE